MQRRDRVSQHVSLILKLGTYSSAVVLLLGFLFLIFFPLLTEVKLFSFSGLVPQLLNLNPYAFINLGALILIFTPFFRVVVAIISFSVEKEIKYVFISVGVLLILLGNIIFFHF